MTSWDEAIAATTFEFIESMEQKGFRADERTLTGTVGEGADAVRVEILVTDSFPFAPPAAWPPSDFPRSWHRELSGAMCLYSADDRQNLPWLDVDDFLALVERWIYESKAGWQQDFPDLDLERYFPQVDAPLIVYGDLDRLGSVVQFRTQGDVVRIKGAHTLPKKKSAAKDRTFGYIIDIGAPEVPPLNWEDLKASVPEEDAALVESSVEKGRLTRLVVRYARDGVGAAVVFAIRKNQDGAVALSALTSAGETHSTLTLRAGVHAQTLADARVAVVGVGAIGSFLCDLLARSGVGRITVYDPDIVRPGNLIRHLADAASEGLPKTEAVKKALESRPFNVTDVSSVPTGMPELKELATMFAEHDLVIDASASGDVTPALIAAAKSGGHHLLSVCLQEEGDVVRVDVAPPLQGEPLKATQFGSLPDRESLRFEAGCGDPVSQTPAFAVYEAAALAARHAVGLLTGLPVSNAGTIRDYR
ncbi:ThiF family adenylyltransferase [Demequina sp. NBRC 110054]|uniref:ThiF family adenylyltransferase n=1 Tax=Demequina sp. NBRC 110054 TaxID=1570343 RepID=UPI0009FD172A|nr:ThiF family adenylyltransferase [Demequina sp. NBRC 110054]